MTIDEILALDIIVLRDYSQEHGPLLDPNEHKKALAKSLSKSEIISVRRHNVLAAYVYLWPIEAQVWFVGGVAIDPRHRSASVMRELIRRFALALEQRGVKSLKSNVYKRNVASVRFHEKLGFQVTRENEFGLEFTLTDLRSIVTLAR